MIKLGQKATDTITGITGIITAKCEYLYGCAQYGITSKGKAETSWFDEGRIRVIGKE